MGLEPEAMPFVVCAAQLLSAKVGKLALAPSRNLLQCNKPSGCWYAAVVVTDPTPPTFMSPAATSVPHPCSRFVRDAGYLRPYNRLSAQPNPTSCSGATLAQCRPSLDRGCGSYL